MRPRQIFRIVVTILLLFFLLSWCAADRHAAFLVFFGRDIGETGYVSDADWSDFEKTVLAPALGAYTVLEGRGGYFSADDETVDEEDTVVVLYVTEDVDAAQDALDDVAEQYKETFSQQSVLVIKTDAEILQGGPEMAEEGGFGRFLVVIFVLILAAGLIVGLMRHRDRDIWR